jgi:hypothetical protein
LDNDYKNIKRIEASIGGYFGSSYTCKVDFVSGEIAWNARKDGVFEPGINLQMDCEGLEMFVEALSECHILTWNNEYIDPHTLDGTQWNLDIEFDHLCIEKSGSNAYPGEWEKFCKVIQELTGKPFE